MWNLKRKQGYKYKEHIAGCQRTDWAMEEKKNGFRAINSSWDFALPLPKIHPAVWQVPFWELGL